MDAQCQELRFRDSRKQSPKKLKGDFHQVLWNVYEVLFIRHQYNVVQHVKKNVKSDHRPQKLKGASQKRKYIGYDNFPVSIYCMETFKQFKKI